MLQRARIVEIPLSSGFAKHYLVKKYYFLTIVPLKTCPAGIKQQSLTKYYAIHRKQINVRENRTGNQE
jgi:hypothetical protein